VWRDFWPDFWKECGSVPQTLSILGWKGEHFVATSPVFLLPRGSSWLNVIEIFFCLSVLLHWLDLGSYSTAYPHSSPQFRNTSAIKDILGWPNSPFKTVSVKTCKQENFHHMKLVLWVQQSIQSNDKGDSRTNKDCDQPSECWPSSCYSSQMFLSHFSPPSFYFSFSPLNTYLYLSILSHAPTVLFFVIFPLLGHLEKSLTYKKTCE
jgi:hypothetical protein